MLLFPNAKINLGLNVVSRRPDGYHDIESVMVPVGWCDILEVVPASGSETTLTVTGREVDCPVEKNLVMKAFRAMEAVDSRVKPVDIFLNKIIPDGAGLGGGSSDAAFTIKAINALFRLGMDDEAMATLAARIGADCPFFIYNRPMLCTGTGTTMSAIDLPLTGRRMSLVIAKPQEGVSTAQAYAGVCPCMALPPVHEAVRQPVENWTDLLHNDFEPSVVAVCPRIGEVKDTLSSHSPIYCSMSGSGSAVYALFDYDKVSDVDLRQELSAQLPDCDIYVESPTMLAK